MKCTNYIPQHASIGSHVRSVDQLVVNWHLTEACNYSCRYCYSRWEKPCNKEELFRNEERSEQLLHELYRFFSSANPSNPLRSRLKWADLRLSLAGGEPLICPQRTMHIAGVAKDLGFQVSLITNGSGLFQKGLEPLFRSLSILGISLDSVDAGSCHQIGRVDNGGKVFSLKDCVRGVEMIRSVNPGISLKINTVVNKCNWHEDLTKVIEWLRPDKWKVLKALPVVSNELMVTEQEFQLFINRHRHLGSVMSVESNSAMTGSYLMVDPLGRFFQNKVDIKTGDSYSYSLPILRCGADAAFRQIFFDVEKFAARYPSFTKEVAA